MQLFSSEILILSQTLVNSHGFGQFDQNLSAPIQKLPHFPLKRTIQRYSKYKGEAAIRFASAAFNICFPMVPHELFWFSPSPKRSSKHRDYNTSLDTTPKNYDTSPVKALKRVLGVEGIGIRGKAFRILEESRVPHAASLDFSALSSTKSVRQIFLAQRYWPGIPRRHQERHQKKRCFLMSVGSAFKIVRCVVVSVIPSLNPCCIDSSWCTLCDWNLQSYGGSVI